MSDSDASTNVSVRDLDYSGLRKAIDIRLNKYFEKLDAPESHERPKAIHRNDFYKFTIRAEEPNVEFIKFVPKIMWCSKLGVYKHVSRERAYELRIVLDEFCEEWCSQWLTGDAGIFFVQIRENMERRRYPRFFTEADLGAHLTKCLLRLDEDFLRLIMAQIVRDEGYGCPIYNEKNEAIFMINIDPSKLSHNNSRKMITAYTMMDVEEIRKFVRDLFYKSCVDQETRGAKIRCDLRLEGQRVISQVKLWEEGDSDYNDVGDEDEDESLKTLIVLCNAGLVTLSFIKGGQLIIDGSTITLDVRELDKPQGESSSESGEQDSADENPEKEKTSDYGVEVEAPDEELSEPESPIPIPRKRPRLWVEHNQLLGKLPW
ncbi:hypothetical protein BPOR_0079g00150 [Botrytis porri]|uniref:Uncharacterized protein n=1 Tax=Botrytis porri TaxID=87229 RepID=A0A4Z1KZX3_9HELO|nr:hypothetical protein BPOR_0079g00150 [Botrytis porri]